VGIFGGFLHDSSFSGFYNCHRFRSDYCEIIIFALYTFLIWIKFSVLCQAIFDIKTRDRKQFLILLNSSSKYFFSLLFKAKKCVSDPEQIVEGGELCAGGAGKDGLRRDSRGCEGRGLDTKSRTVRGS
jgi:hypothetical protein